MLKPIEMLKSHRNARSPEHFYRCSGLWRSNPLGKECQSCGEVIRQKRVFLVWRSNPLGKSILELQLG